MSDEEQEVTVDEQVVADTPSEEQKAEDERKSYTQEELDAIITKRLNRERKKWSREVEEVHEPVLPSERPRLEQFSDHADYLRAIVEYDAEAIAKVKYIDRVVAEKERDVTDKYDDYYDVTHGNKNLRLSDLMREIIVDSDILPDLFYYIGNNVKEANRISQLPISKQAREMARLEKLVEGQLKEQSKPGKFKNMVSKAPAPISPVKGNDNVKNVSLDDYDPATLSMAEYERMYRKAVAEKL